MHIAWDISPNPIWNTVILCICVYRNRTLSVRCIFIRTFRMCQSARSFCLHQHGFEHHISLVQPSRICYEYSQSWNAALYNYTKLVLRGSTSRQEASREKGRPLRKHTNKDYFRCLITIWIIGIARRGLNELIFVKTSDWKKLTLLLLFFFACSLFHAQSDSFCQHGAYILKNAGNQTVEGSHRLPWYGK